MKILSMFPSKYLKAADLGDLPHDVTINRVETGLVGEGDDEEERPVVFFNEYAKGLVLNVTNAKRIQKLYGDETDDWPGQRITICASECEFKGDTVPCIRVRPNAPTKRAAAKKAPAKPTGKGHR